MGDDQYDRMEAEARAKKPQDRTHQEVCFLDSLDEMRQAEREARHPIAWAIFKIGVIYIVVVPMGYTFYELTKRLWSIYGDSIINMFIWLMK